MRRRNAHQSRNFQPVALAAGGEEPIGFLWKYTRFLWLVAGVDLDEEGRFSALPCDFSGQRLGKAWPVNVIDCVEYVNRLLCFVGLQRTHDMKLQDWLTPPQCRPFGLRLLDPVLSKH